jgi:hypothetical protein
MAVYGCQIGPETQNRIQKESVVNTVLQAQ